MRVRPSQPLVAIELGYRSLAWMRPKHQLFPGAVVAAPVTRHCCRPRTSLLQWQVRVVVLQPALGLGDLRPTPAS